MSPAYRSCPPVIQRSRAGGANRTVSQSIMTGPFLVIKMLLIFGSPPRDQRGGGVRLRKAVGGPCIGASLTSVVTAGCHARHGAESRALVVDDELRVDITSWLVADLADRAADLMQLVNGHL